jgi:hypothetical protein
MFPPITATEWHLQCFYRMAELLILRLLLISKGHYVAAR